MTERPEPSAPSASFPQPSARAIARWMLVATALGGIALLLSAAGTALLPFVIGSVLAYLLLQPVNLLSRYLPRWAAILVVYAVSLGLIIGFVAYVVPLVANQISRFVTAIPAWANNQVPLLSAEFDSLISAYHANVPTEIQATIDASVLNGINTFRANAIIYVTSLGTFLINQVISVVNTVIFLFGFLIVPFWLFYVLKDYGKAVAFVDRILPPAARADVWNVAALIDRALSGYIRGQLVLGVAVGTFAGIGLMVLNALGFEVDFVLLLALIAGFTELIPFVGPIIGAIPAILVGLTTSPTTGLAVLLLYFLIQQLENQFLVPRIVGESLDVHPAILMMTLIIGAQVAGILGVILAAPLTAIARDLFVYTYTRLGEPAAPSAAPIEAAAPLLPVAPPSLRDAVPPVPAPATTQHAPVTRSERTNTP